MQTVYPNQVATYTVEVFGAGGAVISAALSNAILNVNGGGDIAAGVSGQTLTATVPVGTALGTGTLRWRWTQVAGGNTSSQDVTEAVTVAQWNGATPTTLLHTPPNPQTLGVGTWRQRVLRSLVDIGTPLSYDAETGAPSAELLPGVFSSDDLDDSLRACLTILSDYRPRMKQMPAFSIVAGQSQYSLPLDFDEPDADSWTPIIGPSPFQTGQYPGSRYQWMRYRDTIDSPVTWQNSRALGYGLGGVGYGFLGMGGIGQFPYSYDANGNLVDGGNQPHGAQFFPPDLDNATAYMVLYPAPSSGRGPYNNLLYKSAHKVYRLTDSGTGWTLDGNSKLVKSLPPASAGFDASTDVLSFVAGDDNVRLSLLYAKWYLLSEKVLRSADAGDSVTYSFFSQQTGKSRTDIANEAKEAWRQFSVRTTRRPHGSRG